MLILVKFRINSKGENICFYCIMLLLRVSTPGPQVYFSLHGVLLDLSKNYKTKHIHRAFVNAISSITDIASFLNFATNVISSE